MRFDFFGPAGEVESLLSQARTLFQSLRQEKAYGDVLGWLDCDEAAAGCLPQVMEIGARWRSQADTLVVVGVGGSNQAARGVISALGTGGMRVIWAGNTLSAWEMRQILSQLEGRSVVMHVIAKNFATLEPGIHYRMIRQWMEHHYAPDDLAWRVVLTGTEGSRLQEMAHERNHVFLPFPGPVGGRFTAFTVVGLLPLAVAGLDVQAYLQGGREASEMVQTQMDHGAFRYAAWRNSLRRQGYGVEQLVSFEPRLERVGRWWRQLFGESEGKEGKGLYPAFATYSEDLHSIGQFVQEGTPFLMETFLQVAADDTGVMVPGDPAARDGFDHLTGMDFSRINRAAETGTLEAHGAGGVPCGRFTLERLCEHDLGELYYTMMAACAASARLLGVNPFNQEGVEAYKRRMNELLKRESALKGGGHAHPDPDCR